MKCPKQNAFAKNLDVVLDAYYEARRDRFSVDESYNLMDEFIKLKKEFVNKWCPTLDFYEEF